MESLQPFFNSFLVVFVGEMGDKTQLLSLLLAVKFKKPWTILAGVFVATILNHALAAWVGRFVSDLVEPSTMRWILAGTFFFFAAWVLIPDKEEEFKERGHFGVFFTTVVAFFLAEMGDKTQLATVALGAMYSDVWVVTLGTTLGMMGSNALAVFMGEKFLAKIPLKWVHLFAAGLFVLIGVTILVAPV